MRIAKKPSRGGAGWVLIGLASVLLPSAAARAATLDRVTVQPADLVLAPTEQRQYTATAHFDDNTTLDITAIAEWTTSDSQHARVSTTHGSRGLVTARDPGEVEIRAALLLPGDPPKKEKGFVKLTVFAGPIVQLKTRPTSKKNLEVGLVQAFTARAVYQNGYEGDVTDECTWTSSHPAIASVNDTGETKGLVTPHALCPLATCNVVISAHHPTSGFTNTDGLIAILPAVTRIEFDQTSYVLGRDMQTQVDVYAYRTDNTRTNISDEVKWEPATPSFFTIGDGGDDGGLLTAITDGEATLHAVDERRDLDTKGTPGARIQVAGLLQSLEVGPNPFRVGVSEQKTATARGRLSSGLTTSDLRKFVDWSVGDPSKAVVGTTGPEIGKVTGKVVGSTTLRAVEPSTGIASALVPLDVRGAVTSITIEPPTATIARGIDYQLRAYANRTDGTRSNISSSAQWSALTGGVVQILTGGKVRGSSNGTTTIRVVDPASGLSSATSGGDAAVTVGGDLMALHVEDVTVPLLELRKAKAIGDLSGGGQTSDLRETVVWTIDDTSLAIVGNVGSTQEVEIGEVKGLAQGQTTIRAREPSSGIESTEVDNLRVQGEIVAVALEAPNNGLVPLNSQATFKARATLSDGTTSNISDKCEWSVDDPTVAVVDNALPEKGKVTGLLFGATSTVRIVCGTRADAKPIQVIGVLQRVEVRPATLEGRVLREKQFRAAGIYAGDFELDITRDCLWSSTDGSVASVSAEGLVKFLNPGETFITATALTGHFGTAVVTVTGGVEAVRLIPSQATMRGSTQRFFRALGSLDSGDDQSVGALAVWTSSNPNVARMSERPGDVGVVIAGPEMGTTTIRATLPGGATATAEVTVNALLVDLWTRRADATLRLGRRASVPIRGRFSDGTEGYIGQYVELRSSDPDVVRVLEGTAGNPKIEAVAPGTAVISALDPVSGLETSGNMTVIVP